MRHKTCHCPRMFWEFTRPDVKHNPADYVEFSRVAESWLEDDRPYAFTFNVEWYDIKIPCFLENTSSEVRLCHLHKLVKSGAPQRERKRTEFPVSDFKIKHLQLLKGRNPPPAPHLPLLCGISSRKNPPKHFITIPHSFWISLQNNSLWFKPFAK